MSCVNPRRRPPLVHPPGKGSESGLTPIAATFALRKGATFHSPTSPVRSSPSDDIFVPPQLSRSQTHLDDVVDANRRRIALTLNDIDEALAKTESHSLLSKPLNKTPLRDNSLPVPRGFLDLPVVDPAVAKPEPPGRISRPRSIGRRRDHASDSGLGSSIVSASEEKETRAQVIPSALTGLGAPGTKHLLPALSRKAFNRIHEHVLGPLVEKPTLKAFEPIILDVPRQIRSKEIICLRDLEKTLIFVAPETAKSAALYLDFCLTSIRCIQATVDYLPDREQVRPGDRPYTNGYFMDLKEQIYQYGRQLAAAAAAASKEEGGAVNADAVDVDKDDEIRLHGGIAENGRPAELIRVKQDGSAISLATGEAVDLGQSPVTFKRSLSEQREDEEEIMRSMARRKKNATAEELAPRRCREPGCSREFKRPCDLTKHEKTHSRPWKCPVRTCKYHESGWPTEKERDRHVNDKHSDAPPTFECKFTGCPYKSKRESNCKQHMEKKHGWTYVRTKTNGKKASAPSASSVQQTPPLCSISTPTSTPTYSVPTPPQDQDAVAFPAYQADAEWLSTHGNQPETLDAMDLMLEHTSPSSSATSYDQYPPYQNGAAFLVNDEDIYAANVQLPADYSRPEQLYNKAMPQQPAVYQAPCPGSQVAVHVHFSPAGRENAMLFTPDDADDFDEGFDESFNNGGSDFQLLGMNKGDNCQQSLFGEVPSANLGFSQASQLDPFHPFYWTDVEYLPMIE
ncbi:uncharacterized protein UV8b_02985 [Ustilaginoidea virens]|uniref:C2H2-type domain-containing protein n=1 Tax=Ustilaginoidea virens TaxID=1159556 RepID=A0A8E5HNS7_USTVR|nr:uncharacterized protein UV8b_02985 [Ustilaginoidea virens]QUC18744.1 hypothetical protein UV8b_02985 [Ustilaginoidea virens]